MHKKHGTSPESLQHTLQHTPEETPKRRMAKGSTLSMIKYALSMIKGK